MKTTTFEDGIRVPLVVAGPGIDTAFETDALVHAADLLATLRAWLRLPAPDVALDSRSFHRALLDPDARGRPYVYCDFVPSNGGPRDQAVVTRRYKLRDVGGIEELYDLADDPTEEQPLDLAAPAIRPLADALRALLANP